MVHDADDDSIDETEEEYPVLEIEEPHEDLAAAWGAETDAAEAGGGGDANAAVDEAQAAALLAEVEGAVHHRRARAVSVRRGAPKEGRKGVAVVAAGSVLNISAGAIQVSFFIAYMKEIGLTGTLIGIIPATFVAIALYEYSVYEIGLPLLAFFTNLLVMALIAYNRAGGRT